MYLNIKHIIDKAIKSKIGVAVWFMFFQSSLIAFNYTPVEIAKILNRANAETNKITHSAIGETDYIVSGDSLFLNPDGTHYLYSYLPSRNTILRLDHSQFHGHHFARHLFLYHGEIYAFGGYGFWNDHAKLIKFDKRTKEWELVMVKNNDVLTGKPIMSILQGDSLFIYGTIQHHVNFQGTSISTNCYVLDLKKLAFSEFKRVTPNLEIQSCSQGFNNQFSKFVIFGTPNSIMYIFDKSKRTIYKNASGPSLWHESNVLKIDVVDSIYRFTVGNELITVLSDLTVDSINLNNYLELYCFEESKFNDWTPKGSEIKWIEFIYKYVILILVILVVFLGYHFLSTGGIYNRKILNQYRQLEEEMDVLDYVDTLKENLFSEHEIDLTFRIYHLPSQVRKIKRSQIINAINVLQPGKIEKVINPKRINQFLYKVNA